MKKLALAALALMLGTFGSPGQAPANLTIKVLAISAEVLPGVTVRLVRPGTTTSPSPGLSAITNARGEAVFQVVPSGTYEAVCALTGFVDTRIGPFSLSTQSYVHASAILNLSWENPDNHMVNPVPRGDQH